MSQGPPLYKNYSSPVFIRLHSTSKRLHEKRPYLMKSSRKFKDTGGVMEPLLDMEETAELLNLTKEQLYEICRTRSRCRQVLPIPIS